MDKLIRETIGSYPLSTDDTTCTNVKECENNSTIYNIIISNIKYDETQLQDDFETSVGGYSGIQMYNITVIQYNIYIV